jgi:hypothetical protein
VRPSGKAIAFVGVDEEGRSDVFVQDFTPGRDSVATRRRIAGVLARLHHRVIRDCP